jgi:hypothetical protein
MPNQAAIWNAGSRRVLAFQFLFQRISPAFVNYLVILFVLGFAWITTAFLATDGAVGVVRKVLRLPPRPLPGAKRRIVRFLIVLGIATMYALTRFATWGNARYLLPVFGIAPLMLYASFVRLGIPPRVRRSVLAALAVLLAISIERSVDPVSRQLYGTFAVGDRDMLRMTGVTGECWGAGRDQLVYNLQHTVMGELTSDATEALVTDSTIVFLPTLTRWFNVGPLDPTTHRRVLRTDRVVTPVVAEPDTLRSLSTPPANAVFIALPNGDPQAALRALSEAYEIGKPRRFRRGGYWLDAYPLTLRDSRGS